ncbi:MAG: hypothetical protein ACEQSA_05935 [Weeksellaceae bacterium]
MVGTIDTSRIVPDLVSAGAAIILDKGLAVNMSEVWLAATYVVSKILYRMFSDTIMTWTSGTGGDYQNVMKFAVDIFVTGVVWHYITAYFTTQSITIPKAILLSGFASPMGMLIKA